MACTLAGAVWGLGRGSESRAMARGPRVGDSEASCAVPRSLNRPRGGPELRSLRVQAWQSGRWGPWSPGPRPASGPRLQPPPPTAEFCLQRGPPSSSLLLASGVSLTKARGSCRLWGPHGSSWGHGRLAGATRKGPDPGWSPDTIGFSGLVSSSLRLGVPSLGAHGGRQTSRCVREEGLLVRTRAEPLGPGAPAAP